MVSAHIASLSDCFSNATVSTRRWTPAITRWAATIAVEPPTLPAVWTRSIGLPAAPRASARYSSGIITPSNMSGALPITTASTSPKPMPASARAASAASRTRPAIETSMRLDACFVWPMPTTAHRSAIAPLQHADQVLLQARAGRGVGQRPPRAPVHHPAGRLADAEQAGHHHRVGRQRPARGVDRRAPVEAQRLPEDQLLVAEGGVELGHVARPLERARPLSGQPGRGGHGEVAGAERVRLDPVVDARDPGRPLSEPAGRVTGRED